MRRTTLIAAVAATMVLATMAPAMARPTSTYTVDADLTGAATSSVSLAFTESGVSSLTMTRPCGDGTEEAWTSTSVVDSTVAFDKRLSAVTVVAETLTTHVACDGTVTNDVPWSVSFDSGQRAGRTERSRVDGARLLSTPMFVVVGVPGFAAQGLVGSFTESISK